MAPVMMRRLPWLCWLALWVTTAKVTSATGVTQSNAEGGNGNSSSLSPADWSCPLEKWSLEERQNRSQVVFTAVIESCQTSESGSVDGETVEDDQELCQRYLMQQSQDQPIVGDPNLAINVRIKKVVKGLDRMWEGRRVRVEGLRDPRICPSRVRLRDTRIFLASYVNQPMSSTIHDDDETLAPVHHQPPIDSAAPIRLRLNSSLMSVSLRHLQQLRAFTKDSVVVGTLDGISVSDLLLGLRSHVSVLRFPSNNTERLPPPLDDIPGSPRYYSCPNIANLFTSLAQFLSHDLVLLALAVGCYIIPQKIKVKTFNTRWTVGIGIDRTTAFFFDCGCQYVLDGRCCNRPYSSSYIVCANVVNVPLSRRFGEQLTLLCCTLYFFTRHFDSLFDVFFCCEALECATSPSTIEFDSLLTVGGRIVWLLRAEHRRLSLSFVPLCCPILLDSELQRDVFMSAHDSFWAVRRVFNSTVLSVTRRTCQ
ncbi:hypothetical protein DAPPUDRAFT_254087 [Daphnia pulex]|uniref:NtA domain-containing protein n=1 Tax=Daphnia pulex TaxID=6669 RepID=E9H691_DAPPU|nr:hypothetical protein DAPPUDRAFT_254087 [Daphnia pulex]|eukprot:EFX72772.1 hypothetical protein DAPPUDRAFT_254087 [Daphnia pulex]